MSQIVVATLGTLGDLHPMIAIALELRQRSHDVVFVTHQVYQSKLEAYGCRKLLPGKHPSGKTVKATCCFVNGQQFATNPITRHESSD
jgi:hypothetical protein